MEYIRRVGHPGLTPAEGLGTVAAVVLLVVGMMIILAATCCPPVVPLIAFFAIVLDLSLLGGYPGVREKNAESARKVVNDMKSQIETIMHEQIKQMGLTKNSSETTDEPFVSPSGPK